MRDLKPLTTQELKQINALEDMLRGNICRMCVSSSSDEIFENYKYAIDKIKQIYRLRLRLEEKS